MKIYDVRFTVAIPDEVRENEILAWLRFKLGDTYEISVNNPLENTELEGKSITVKRYS
jgi:hypothetical protein